MLKEVLLVLGLPVLIWIWLVGWTLYTVDMPGVDVAMSKVVKKLKEANCHFAVIRES